MLSSLISDIVSAFTIAEVEAEAPEMEEDKQVEQKEEKEEAPAEPEEEEEEEPVDILPKLQEECAKSAKCKPYTHHYEECVSRVTGKQEAGEDPKEDCVEEFFHMLHCSAQCAAPKLFAQLK
ncbi:Non-heme 11 kDa protein of cytochrome bc1 complex [Terfezia boudieri ATCC MYA-4762]|uniref:Cytochrome b-c1 complex subunit 6, mitochondrial n=1 Tax=Terfezia boudieri ATCC MYA-4762 TaxID=1051890 RepID=A0A3N4LF87_9PEZI|nr:Non-heme 11 kDa protein of cytochrome bc1 complex [Terfezia boudieri ATCC MYA-4762]